MNNSLTIDELDRGLVLLAKRGQNREAWQDWCRNNLSAALEQAKDAHLMRLNFTALQAQFDALRLQLRDKALLNSSTAPQSPPL
jgi:hypothetical protein